MGKRIVIREIEPLELVFKDKILTCTMNNDSLMLFTEMYGDIQKIAEKEKNKPYTFAAKLLFCGVKVNNPDFTYEESEKIIVSGGLSLIAELFDNLTQNFMTNATLEQKEHYMGELERLLKSMK